MHTYSLVDRATGDVIEADKATVERIAGIEIAYIDWAKVMLLFAKRYNVGFW